MVCEIHLNKTLKKKKKNYKGSEMLPYLQDNDLAWHNFMDTGKT